MSIQSNIRPGLWMIGLSTLGIAAGAWKADYNETHLFNDRWPPHAKFHDGQTISLATICMPLALYYAMRPAPTLVLKKDSLFTSVIFASIFGLTGLSALLYPNTKGQDPEFTQYMNGNPQIAVFGVFLSLAWLGYWIEKRQVEREMGGSSKKNS